MMLSIPLRMAHVSRRLQPRRLLTTSSIPQLTDLEINVEDLNHSDVLQRAKSIYDEHGVLVVRGLNRKHVKTIKAHADRIFKQSLTLLENGKAKEHINPASGLSLGYLTPDQTLWIPAEPNEKGRDKQVMVLGLDYLNSSALFDAATDNRTLDLVQLFLDDENIELFSKGQCFYKEGSPADAQRASNPKLMHQDSAYFMFAKQGACATLNYSVDTSTDIDNGPLYVVPGSHRNGHIAHVDTPSHLGLAENQGEPVDFPGALVVNGEAGDAIFFNIHTVHGSTANRSPESRASFINRYITSDDYQTYFATDTVMRKEARAKYEEGVAIGMLPAKERNFIVRGMRSWDDDGPSWLLNEGVNH